MGMNSNPLSLICSKKTPVKKNPLLDQTYHHLKEVRNYFCMDVFKTFDEVWHCEMICAKLFHLLLGISKSFRRKDLQGYTLFCLTVRLTSYYKGNLL